MAWQSVMWEHPEHLQAIGMISIEINNVESFFASLLSEILEIEPSVGRAIYWKAQSASLRMGIVEAAAEKTFAVRFRELSEDPRVRRLEIEMNDKLERHLDRSMDLVKRAAKASFARHEVMHEIWGTDNASGAVSRAKANTKKPHRVVPLIELQNLIARIRKVIDDTRAFTSELFKERIDRQMAASETQAQE